MKCEYPYCHGKGVIRHNGFINLCVKCNELVHHRSNHELARYFNSYSKIVKLLSALYEFEGGEKEKEAESFYKVNEKSLGIAPVKPANCQHSDEKGCEWAWCKKNNDCILKEYDRMRANYGIAKASRSIRKETIKQQPVKQVPVSKIEGVCENPLCNSGEGLSRHHLYPKDYRYMLDGMPVPDEEAYKKIVLCQECHTLIHQVKSNYELAKYYNTNEKLIQLLQENEIHRIAKKENSDKLVRCINIYCGTSENLTRHHLIPKPYRKGLVVPSDKVYLCLDCHKRVHQLATNKQLADSYSTRDAIIRLLAEDKDKKFRLSRFMDVYINESNSVMAVA